MNTVGGGESCFSLPPMLLFTPRASPMLDADLVNQQPTLTEREREEEEKNTYDDDAAAHTNHSTNKQTKYLII